MARRDLLLGALLLAAAPAAARAGAPPEFEDVLKIDVHSHIFEDVPEVVAMMDRAHVRIVNVCVRGTNPERLRQQEATAERLQEKYGKKRFPFEIGRAHV